MPPPDARIMADGALARRALPLILSFAFLVRTAHAADPIPIESLGLEDLLDLEAGAATKNRMPISETPAVVSVVTRPQLRAWSWHSLNDVLYHQPGFTGSREFERRTVAARGHFSNWNNNRL